MGILRIERINVEVSGSIPRLISCLAVCSYFGELSFREIAFKPRMKHVSKVLMYMDSARDPKLLSFENDESLQIRGFLGRRQACLKKSSASKWQFLELTITKSTHIHAQFNN